MIALSLEFIFKYLIIELVFFFIFSFESITNLLDPIDPDVGSNKQRFLFIESYGKYADNYSLVKPDGALVYSNIVWVLVIAIFTLSFLSIRDFIETYKININLMVNK